MNIPETIKQSIEVLSDKFGATGQYLFELLVKSTFISGITDLVIGIILLISTYLVYKKFGIYDYNKDISPLSIFYSVPLLLGIVLILLSIQPIFIPEAVLIKDLLGIGGCN